MLLEQEAKCTVLLTVVLALIAHSFRNTYFDPFSFFECETENVSFISIENNRVSLFGKLIKASTEYKEREFIFLQLIVCLEKFE